VSAARLHSPRMNARIPGTIVTVRMQTDSFPVAPLLAAALAELAIALRLPLSMRAVSLFGVFLMLALAVRTVVVVVGRVTGA